jgi:hypothetical protein
MSDLYFPSSGSSSSTLVATAEYPDKLDTDASLVDARNKATTTLTAAVNNSDNAFNVADTGTFPPAGVAVCEDEVFTYSGKTSTTLTGIVRGFESTSAVSHSSGATVDLQITQSSNNEKSRAIQELQLKLGTEASIPTKGRGLQGTGNGSSQWLPVREVLNGNRSYFVNASTGNNNNDGRTVTTPFATIQAAVEAVAKIDCGGFNVVIEVADGTYAETVSLRNTVGVASNTSLTIRGNTTTPANCTVRGFSASSLQVVWNLNGFRTDNASNITHLNCIGSVLRVSNWNFGTAGSAPHMLVYFSSQLTILTNYTISGNAATHINILGLSFVDISNRTITVTNTPTISFYIIISQLSYCYLYGNTWSAQITGTRYSAATNSIFFVNSATPNTYMALAGNVNGSAATGAQVI